MLRSVKRAVGRFDLFSDNDHAIVAISGGIDSLTLFDLITEKNCWWSRSVKFTPVHIDAGFPRENEGLEAMREFVTNREHDLIVVERPEIAELAMRKDRPQNPCFICSRLRRKALIETADKIGANKIALGHHREDVLQTVLINLFWGRQISGIMPNQPLFQGRFHLIRPLFFVREGQIKESAKANNIHDLSASCPVDGGTKRDYVRGLLDRLERENPGLKSNMFRALFHVKHDYLLDRYKMGD